MDWFRRFLTSVVLLAIVFPVLNNSAVAQWHIPTIPGVGPNTAVNLNNDCFRLTAGGGQRGVVWDSTQLNLANPFDITLSVMQGPWGADGLALVLQTNGLNSWGDGGNGLGYASAVPPGTYPGITPSIAFELDTWPNQGAGVADINPDHVAIHLNGNITTALAGPVPALGNSGDVTDSICRRFRVKWNPIVDSVEVYYNDVLRIRQFIDIPATVFGGSTAAWWGITGSSGGAPMNQVVCVGANFANAGLDRSVCPGDTVHLNASGGTQYFWGIGAPLISNQNIPNPVFNSLIPLTYNLNVLVTNIAGCTDRDTARIIVDAFPTAITGNPAPFCLGDSTQLGAPTNPNFGYAWSPPTDLSGTSIAQPWFVPTAPGTFNYELVVTNNGGLAGCTDTANVAIVVNDTPTVTLSAAPAIVCQGQSTILTANATGGSGTYTYLWSSGGTLATETVTPNASQTYTVTVTDNNTCGTIASILVTVADTPTVAITSNPDTICAGQSATLTATASGGTGVLTYAWSSGGTTNVEVVAPQATTTFTVVVSDAQGCSSSANSTLVVNVADSIDITVPDTFVCNNGSIDIVNTFGTAGIDTWTWSPAAGVSTVSVPNPTISPATSTTYYLAGLNSLTGCGYTDSIRIDNFELLVSHWADSSICLGDTIQFDIQPTGGSGDYSFTWLSNTGGYISDDTLGNPFVSPGVTTVYTVMASDNVTGCAVTFVITINVSELNVQASPDVITINPGQRVQLEATGAMFYAWTPDTTINCTTCPDPVVTPEMSMSYTVLGWDTSGCRGTDIVQIVVDSFVVPNVFTPNGDGINDELFFNYYGSGFYETSVFDRWGNQIFTTKSTTSMWNGTTSSGAKVTEGVYYVVVRIIGDDAIPDKDKQKVFYVTLIR